MHLTNSIYFTAYTWEPRTSNQSWNKKQLERSEEWAYRVTLKHDCDYGSYHISRRLLYTRGADQRVKRAAVPTPSPHCLWPICHVESQPDPTTLLLVKHHSERDWELQPELPWPLTWRESDAIMVCVLYSSSLGMCTVTTMETTTSQRSVTMSVIKTCLCVVPTVRSAECSGDFVYTTSVYISIKQLSTVRGSYKLTTTNQIRVR